MRRHDPFAVTRRERVAWWVDKMWHCRIRGRHQMKMATRPRCYRCGHRMTWTTKGGEGQWV